MKIRRVRGTRGCMCCTMWVVGPWGEKSSGEDGKVGGWVGG